MRSPLPLAFSRLTLLAIALVVLPVGPSLAQGTADVSLEQRIQAALAKAGFDPGPADSKFGPKTRRAIQAWQRANGYDGTGYLTREQLRSILTKALPTVTLEPKCAELPGQYLGDSHAECWEEIENQSGCFLWRTHYHSDQTTKWTGQCRNGVAEGHGIYSVSAGSEHSSYEGAGMLVNGKANGSWVEKWADGGHYEGEFRDGKRHGHGTFTYGQRRSLRGRVSRRQAARIRHLHLVQAAIATRASGATARSTETALSLGPRAVVATRASGATARGTETALHTWVPLRRYRNRYEGGQYGATAKRTDTALALTSSRR